MRRGDWGNGTENQRDDSDGKVSDVSREKEPTVVHTRLLSFSFRSICVRDRALWLVYIKRAVTREIWLLICIQSSRVIPFHPLPGRVGCEGGAPPSPPTRSKCNSSHFDRESWSLLSELYCVERLFSWPDDLFDNRWQSVVWLYGNSLCHWPEDIFSDVTLAKSLALSS